MMEKKKIANNIWQVALSLFLGGAILYWMYRGFDFKQVEEVLLHKMSWTWMLLSFPFGISAQLFRGWRWKQALEPIGEKSRSSVSINSIFLSYALSLVIPRSGEFARCAVLKRWDGVSFPKALGTVVTERAIDSLLVLLITGLVFLMQILRQDGHEHGQHPGQLHSHRIPGYRHLRHRRTLPGSHTAQETGYI